MIATVSYTGQPHGRVYVTTQYAPGAARAMSHRRTSGVVAEPLRHHVRHSPDGFSWGYFGSGPSELARCLLIDALGVENPAVERCYQAFKFAVVGRWPQDEAWQISRDEILRWVAENDQK